MNYPAPLIDVALGLVLAAALVALGYGFGALRKSTPTQLAARLEKALELMNAIIKLFDSDDFKRLVASHEHRLGRLEQRADSRDIDYAQALATLNRHERELREVRARLSDPEVA